MQTWRDQAPIVPSNPPVLTQHHDLQFSGRVPRVVNMPLRHQRNLVLVERQFGDTPKYCVLDEQGPDHNKCFKISAEIARRRYPPAWGANKKDAEQRAALNALSQLAGEPIPFEAE